MPSLLERYLIIGKLPDGRWAIENAQPLDRLTAEDIEAIARVIYEWAAVHLAKLDAREE